MKKLISISLMAVMFIACGNKNESNEQTDETSVDTTASEEASEENEETAAVVELITPDLTLCEVQGNVKSIVYTDIPSTTFTEEGMLLTYESLDKISHEKRNDNGQLTYFLGSDWMTVVWDTDRPSEITDQMNEMSIVRKLTYDENGRVVAVDQVISDEIEGDSIHDKITYNYTSEDIDEHGNWVKRTVTFAGQQPFIETREIEYYQ